MARNEHRPGRGLGVLLLLTGLAAGVSPAIALHRLGYRTPASAGALPNPAAVRTEPGGQAVRPLVHPPTAFARPPDRLVLPRLGMDAKVVPVEVGRSGALDVPSDPRTLGWWNGSHPLGGSHGSAVIVGHVDSAALGRGVFFDLEKASPGDTVRVFAGDKSLSYSVIARRVYVKSALPGDLFAAGGPPYLVLITCGGPFDERTRHYRDNVVVYALRR